VILLSSSAIITHDVCFPGVGNEAMPAIPKVLITAVEWYSPIHERFDPELLQISSGHMQDIRVTLAATIGSVFMFGSEKWNPRIIAEVMVRPGRIRTMAT